MPVHEIFPSYVTESVESLDAISYGEHGDFMLIPRRLLHLVVLPEAIWQQRRH
ncbi:MAG: hypothetical protein U5K72_18275 [Balneolaceae bacterium]|nr:hypothetical protein [Balneolaceae bacterium]